MITPITLTVQMVLEEHECLEKKFNLRVALLTITIKSMKTALSLTTCHMSKTVIVCPIGIWNDIER